MAIVQQALLRRHELQTARAARLSSFSAHTWATTLALGELARATLEAKREVYENQDLQDAMDSFNTAMAQIQLLENGEVYTAAHTIDRCLVSLTGEALSQQFSRNDWRDKRTDLSHAIDEYHDAARAALKSGRRPASTYLIQRADIGNR